MACKEPTFLGEFQGLIINTTDSIYKPKTRTVVGWCSPASHDCNNNGDEITLTKYFQGEKGTKRLIKNWDLLLVKVLNLQVVVVGKRFLSFAKSHLTKNKN